MNRLNKIIKLINLSINYDGKPAVLRKLDLFRLPRTKPSTEACVWVAPSRPHACSRIVPCGFPNN